MTTPRRLSASLRRAAQLGLALLVATTALGCEDETGSDAPDPQPLPLPEVPEPSYDEGHLSVEQRGVALDSEDVPIIIQGAGNAGISTETIRDAFGLLVLNRPYVDWRVTRCPRSDEAATVQPRQTSERILEELEQARGLTFDRVAVNVDLLTPGRRGLLHVCFDRGESETRFGSAEHREKVIEAFRDLAGLPGLEYVTVGVELNRYYHLAVPPREGAEPIRVTDDFTNLATLYHEVYAAIKEVNPDVQVGPGLSWAVFMNRTVPELANEYQLDEQEDRTEAVWRAWRRTVEPFLYARRGNDRVGTADYLGVTAIPFTSEEPFGGEPSFDPEEDPESAQAVLDHYLYLPVVADGLPVALTRIDWPVDSPVFGNQKGLFLETLKEAVSHVDLAWAAWRRTGDLQSTVAASNTCNAYTQAAEPTLSYPKDFCFSGMVNESGESMTRGVIAGMTAAP